MLATGDCYTLCGYQGGGTLVMPDWRGGQLYICSRDINYRTLCLSCVTVSHRSHGILQLNHQMREQRFSGICCWKQNNLLYILFVLRINTVEKAGENASNVWKCPIKIPIISL